MDWTSWMPQEQTLASIKQLLQDALIPNSAVQKDVQSKLKKLEIVEDFTYYLLYIVGQPAFSEEIRSLSGILLKNNIATVYDKLSPESVIKIRLLCLRLLRDPCRDVRTSMSNVIYTLAKHELNTWTDLIPFLVKSFETPDEYGELALTTLFCICEDMINLEKSEEEICAFAKEVFPRFVDFLADEKCDKKQNIIKLTNQFLQDHYKVMKQSIDLTKYLRNVMRLADSDDLEMQKYICHAFVMYVEYREECLLPHLHDVIMYLMVKTQHEDLEVALGACEFWLAVTKLSNCKDILTPYVDKLLPVLLKNMKYSTFELIALKDTLRTDDQIDDTKESFPFHMHEKRVRDEEDYSNEGGDFLSNCDEMDDFYIGWTLRKCSAASLDALAVNFGDDILPLLVPFLNELLYHQDYLIKESAILALGAISEGCLNGLKPHLPYLIEYLIQTMNDEHSTVRVITCWTLSRYVSWIINSQSSHSVYFIPVMTTLLKHFMDDNKRVQRAAISAFCVFQEEAQMQLIPYIDLILEGFQLGFQKFNNRSLYLLYDAINVLALSVGNELNKPEYIDKLMPPLMQKLSEYTSYSEDRFIAVLECLANIIPSLDDGFLPFSEVVYLQCMEIIMDTFMAYATFEGNLHGFDPPDKEPMHIALDVLYSMAVALKSYFYKYVTNSNLVCLLYTMMQDCSYFIRQSSIALYGELVLICYPYLSSNVGDYIKLIIKNLDEGYEGVCKNAAWVVGKLTTVMGDEIRPYVPEILTAFVNILRNPTLSRAMHQTVAVSMCTLCCVCPDISIAEADTVLKNCCMSLRSLKDSDEKDLAFRGLCHVVVRHPEFCQSNFMYFCDAVASWNSVKPDLKETIKNILVSFKEQCGEMHWIQFYGQFPELLKLQLYNLKCPQNLIAPLIQIVIDETRKSCKKQPTACGFNPSDNAYEPLKLMQTVMAKTNEICLRYLDNSMLCSLPSPGLPHNIVSMCAAKNKRRRMEDRHVVVHDLNTMFNIQEASPSSYYAIFDGHAGHDAATYSAAHLHQFLAESKHFVANPEQALLDAFCKTDALFIDKCNVERFNSGTTAVCALLRPKEKTLYIAWVGDSQALLVNQGRVLQCVNPHKPCRADEKERIEKEGGYVCYWGTWRVNGQLAVSRAIGDAEYKPYVIAVPDIREIPLDGGEDFLILACDGLWDFLSEDDAARAVYEMVCSNPDKTDQISERLVYLSKERGSADNISVIVVFLREPSKIAAEAHWANRNTMDTSLDNANNPFANSNGADNSILPQKADGLLLNLSENFKHNGSDLSPAGDFYHNTEKSNGKRPASEFDDDDDLGPETDVDAVDDVLSPSIVAAKALAEGIVNNNPDGSFNPFVEKHEVEKAALEIDLDLQKQQSSEFDGQRSPREETPTPPADAVHDGGLEENVADSGEESEDEWNYIRGEEANKENVDPTQPDSEVADILEDDQEDSMSQLNPNAAEFVPVSPTRSIPSPACRALINDPVLAQSPKRPSEIDINLPSPQEFENEVKSKPSEFDLFSNGHDHESDQKSHDLMENLLNGKNIDEIPEFQPGNTPTKAVPSEEFHFGPNAAPFTPVKLLDQSEATASTKAVYGGDETLDSALDTSQDNVDFTAFKGKEDDPMSMSFYQDKSGGDVDPFDLNQVQELPDDLENFLNKPDDTKETVGDLISDEVILNNDERIQTTDLDKVVDEEKELASPASDDDDDSSGVCELSKSPQPQTDDLIEQLECSLPKQTLPDVCLRPELLSPRSEAEDLPTTESISPVCPIPSAFSPELQETAFIVEQTFSQEIEAPSPEPQELVLSPEPREPVPETPELVASPEPQEPILSVESQEPVLTPEPQEPVLTPEPQEPILTPEPQEQVLTLEPQEQVLTPELQEPILASEPQEQILTPEPQEPILASEPQEPVLAPEQQQSILTVEPQEPNLSPEPQESALSLEPQQPVWSVEPQELVLSSEAQQPILEQEPVSFTTPQEPVLTPEPEAPTPVVLPVEPAAIDVVTSEPELVSKSPEPQPVPEAVLEAVEDVCKYETDEPIESPIDDVTSSVKDTASPISSPLPADQVAEEPTILLNFAQELNSAVQATVPVESSSPIVEPAIPDLCPISTPKSVTDTESVVTTDLNSFLDRSNITELASPLSPGEAFSRCVYPEPTEIKTEKIVPEFAEAAVLSPIDLKEEEETPSAPSLLEETVKESQVAPVLAAAAGVAAVGVAAAAVAEKKITKPKTSTAPTTKKPAPKTTAAASPTKPAAPSPAKPRTLLATKTKPSTTPKAATTPTARTSTGAVPKVTAARPAPKPKTFTSTSAPKIGEKKPLANGDVKAPPRVSQTRKSLDSPKSPATKPTTATTKPVPAKTAAPRPITAPTKTATKPAPTTAAPRARPTTLPNKTTASSVTKPAPTATRVSLSKTTASPKTTSPTKPRPTTAPLTKPKVPLTKTVSKASADTEKQIKDSANKLTASRTVTSTRTTGMASSRTVTSTVRKTEAKVTGTTRTTLTKTTTTTTRPGAGAGKKPLEITRNKTKSSGDEKPIQNGVATVVLEEITIVNDSEPQMMKDNSPIDNKLIVDANAAD